MIYYITNRQFLLWLSLINFSKTNTIVTLCFKHNINESKMKYVVWNLKHCILTTNFTTLTFNYLKNISHDLSQFTFITCDDDFK